MNYSLIHFFREEHLLWGSFLRRRGSDIILHPPYAPAVYETLADIYRHKERYLDKQTIILLLQSIGQSDMEAIESIYFFLLSLLFEERNDTQISIYLYIFTEIGHWKKYISFRMFLPVKLYLHVIIITENEIYDIDKSCRIIMKQSYESSQKNLYDYLNQQSIR